MDTEADGPVRADERKRMKYPYYDLLWLFFAYSVLGWCAGVTVTAVGRRRFVNTGVLNLPCCPVYGVAAVAYSVLLPELKTNLLFLFVGGMLISAFLIFVTGIVLERIFHRKWWYYNRLPIGFKRFFNVPLLLTFGAAAIFVLWVGNPLLLRLVRLLPRGIGRIVLAVLSGLLLVDLSGALAVVWKWRKHINRVAAVTDNMQKVSTTFGTAIARAVQRRLERSYPNLETKKILAAKAEETKKEKVRFAEGCGFYKLVWLFLIGAMIGDLVETVFCRITMDRWMSRSSVVYGHFSIVWGFACAMLTAFLYRYRDRSDGFIFCYGTVAGGAYEYFCSVLSELLFGAVFWDYSKIPFNLGGRINLLYCFFWGIAAVVWLKFIYPFLSGIIEKIPRKTGPVITWVMIVLMTANIMISAAALARYSHRQQGMEPANAVEEALDTRFPDQRMERIYPKAKFVK